MSARRVESALNMICELHRLGIDFVFAFGETETGLLLETRVKADKIWGT